MLVLAPVKAEAASDWLTENTVNICVSEKKTFSYGEFCGRTASEYYVGSQPSGDVGSAVVTETWSGVRVEGVKCGTIELYVGLGSSNHRLCGMCKITVKVIDKSFMTGKSTMDINKKATFKTEGSKAVKWWSKNKKVATVRKSGVVTTKKVGKTVIYAKDKKHGNQFSIMPQMQDGSSRQSNMMVV